MQAGLCRVRAIGMNYGGLYSLSSTPPIVRYGSRPCKNADAETFRAIIEPGRLLRQIIAAAMAAFLNQYFVSVSEN